MFLLPYPKPWLVLHLEFWKCTCIQYSYMCPINILIVFALVQTCLALLYHLSVGEHLLLVFCCVETKILRVLSVKYQEESSISIMCSFFLRIMVSDWMMHFSAWISISVGSVSNCYPSTSVDCSLLMADIRCLPGLCFLPCWWLPFVFTVPRHRFSFY